MEEDQQRTESMGSAMNVTVMRRIRFNAGHRLLGHEGKCANFHGHNYVADVFVSGTVIDDVGRLIDFAQLRDLLKGWVDEHWDHGFVLSEADENGIAAIRSVRPTKLFLLPDNPTSENMARYLLETVCPELLAPFDVRAVRVDLWETEETCAIATVDDVPSMGLNADRAEQTHSAAGW